MARTQLGWKSGKGSIIYLEMVLEELATSLLATEDIKAKSMPKRLQNTGEKQNYFLLSNALVLFYV